MENFINAGRQELVVESQPVTIAHAVSLAMRMCNHPRHSLARMTEKMEATPHALYKKYEEALSRNDLPAIQALFTSDAVVTAPITGTLDVVKFHTTLFSYTKKASANLPNVIRRRKNPTALTVQFSYTFLTTCGKVAVIDGAAIFEFDDEQQKFRKLTLVYNDSDMRLMMAEPDKMPCIWTSEAS